MYELSSDDVIRNKGLDFEPKFFASIDICLQSGQFCPIVCVGCGFKGPEIFVGVNT